MSKRKSLADKISGLLNTAPSYNPDEENDVESSAKVVDYEPDQGNDDAEEEYLLSQFRKQNAKILEDEDVRYAGKKSSRNQLRDSEDDSDDYGNQFDSDFDEEPDAEDSDDNADNEQVDSEDDNVGTEDDAENLAESMDEDEGLNDLSEEDDEQFKHIDNSNVKALNKKSLSVKNQINIWESLLEVRIQLQKCLSASNKLPASEVYSQMKQQEAEFADKTDGLKKTLSSTLGNMIELQQLLIKQFPESKTVLRDSKKTKKPSKSSEEDDNIDSDDEEIPSDTEDEEEKEEEKELSDNEDDEEAESQAPKAKKRKRSNNELEHEINQIHNKYKPFRNSVIQKWNDKTHIAQGKNASVNSVLDQIDYILSDKPKLLKRTQLMRSEYRIIGFEEPEPNADNNEIVNEYNVNIFDDDDFYHQLLRELIEVKSADITDPIQLSRQWVQLQSMRSKMKRKVDTKATKGRKIRYGIHTKLVNFMAPILTDVITDEAQTELFSSLFGNKTLSK